MTKTPLKTYSVTQTIDLSKPETLTSAQKQQRLDNLMAQREQLITLADPDLERVLTLIDDSIEDLLDS